MSSRNVFENNEIPDDERDIDALGGEGPAFVLPALDDTHKYVFEKLPSGKVAILTEEVDKPAKLTSQGKTPPPPPAEDSCGCGKYQGCARCRKYVGSGLNDPESRTLRHQQGEIDYGAFEQ